MMSGKKRAVSIAHLDVDDTHMGRHSRLCRPLVDIEPHTYSIWKEGKEKLAGYVTCIEGQEMEADAGAIRRTIGDERDWPFEHSWLGGPVRELHAIRHAIDAGYETGCPD
jgi:hypothetical protein